METGMDTSYHLHPMIGMSLVEQEEWFDDRIQEIYDMEPPISCNNLGEPGKDWNSRLREITLDTFDNRLETTRSWGYNEWPKRKNRRPT